MPRAPGTSTGQGHDSIVTPAFRIGDAERTAALDDAPWAVAWLDEDGTIGQANRACADLLGLDADQLPGRALADLLDDAQSVWDVLEAARRDRDRVTVELKCIGSGDAAGRIACDVVPLLERGEVAGTRWYLRPAVESPGGVVAGDRTPVAQPAGLATSGLDLLDIEGADAETVRVMRQGVEQLSRLVDDVLRQSEASDLRKSGASAAVSPAGTSRAAIPLSGPAAATRILIVDDHPAIGRSLTLLFHGLGVRHVETASTGRDALALLEQFRPDIVLLDIGLPDVNGYDVARSIRSSDAGRDVLLVALSGYGHSRQKYHDEPAAAGFDEHLVKPCGVEAILRLLDHPRLQQAAPQSPGGSTEAADSLANRREQSSDSSVAAGSDAERTNELLHRTGEFLREVVHDARTAAFPLQIQLHLLKNQGRLEVEEIARLLSDYLAMCEKLHGSPAGGDRAARRVLCEFRPVELNDLISRAADALRGRGEAEGVELECCPNLQPLQVTGDPDSLLQAAGELLENALQATPAGGRITVQLLHEDECAVILVSDTGAGIQPEVAARLMQPFDRQGRKLEPLNGRAGLGLAIARRIVEEHHGRLLLRPAATGGCAASLELPLSHQRRNPVS